MSINTTGIETALSFKHEDKSWLLSAQRERAALPLALPDPFPPHYNKPLYGLKGREEKREEM